MSDFASELRHFTDTFPADHPHRAQREEVTYARYACLVCPNVWTLAVFEGEIPQDANVCRCGGRGVMRSRS